MVIRTVDQSDTHIFTGELLRCLESTKSRSNNHHIRFFGRGVLHGTRMFAERKPMRGFIVAASLPAPYRAAETGKAVVSLATNAIFLALCRNRLRAVRHVSQWQNASRSPHAARF